MDYTLPSGANHLDLPLLYVSVPHIIALDPAEQAASNGATVTFSVTLSNPGTSSVLYTLTVSQLPGVTWGPLAPLNVPADSAVTVPLTAVIALDAEPASLPFGIFVDGDQAGGILTLTGPALRADIVPESAGVPTGEAAARTYDLTAAGLGRPRLARASQRDSQQRRRRGFHRPGRERGRQSVHHSRGQCRQWG